MLPTSLSPSNSLICGRRTHPLPSYKPPSKRDLPHPSASTPKPRLREHPDSPTPFSSPSCGPPIPSRRSQPLPWHLQLLCHQKPSPQCPLSFSPLRLACPHQWPRPLLGPTAVGPRSLTGDALHGPRSRCPILPG